VSKRIIDGDGFSLQAPADWCEITGQLETNSTLTLALADGVGALQLSLDRGGAGSSPKSSSRELDAMLMDFADANDLGEPRERACDEGPPAVAAATFVQPDEATRIWYVSDGRNFAKATYTHLGTQLPDDELEDCEAMVRSITWPKRT
jgi:hypothetical protein